MSAAGPPPGDPRAAGAPGEEELLREQRAAYEAELARITVPDMLMQATVSLLNLAAHRLAPAAPGAEGEGAGRDLEQVRDAIDGVRALLDILERRMPGELKPLRDALSQLQMAYAAEVSRPEAGQPGGQAGGEPAGGSQAGGAAGGGEVPSGDNGGEGPSGDDGDGDAGGDEGPGGSGGDEGPGGGGPGRGGSDGGGAPAQPGGSDQPERGPGPAESSGRLWVPGR